MEVQLYNKKLKILYITRNFEKRMEKSSLYLAEELSRLADLKTWQEDGHIRDIIEKSKFKPDFILLNDYKYDYCPFVWGFSEVNVPVGAIMHDLKYKIKHRRSFYLVENINPIFTVYRDAALKWFPDLSNRFIWLPHHVPLEVYKDYGLQKDINYLMSGMMLEKLYPERVKMMRLLKNEPGFVYHSHPGYGELAKSSSRGVVIGHNYAKALNRAKMFITCDSIDHFPVMKYFEALASNTLLLATSSEELKDLGFIDGETFVAVNESNILEKARYYLKHEDERKAIAERGYRMVRERHSTAVRARQLLAQIQRITAGYFDQ